MLISKLMLLLEWLFYFHFYNVESSHGCLCRTGRHRCAYRRTIANKFGHVFKLDEKTKPILVMAEISAGFGSVFGTPIAGAFFGMEMCFIGEFSIKQCFLVLLHHL